LLRLHYNENPHGVSDDLMKKALAAVRELPLQWYPDQELTQLKEVLGDYAEVNTDKLMIGNGSDDLIQLVLMSHLGKIQRVVIPVPTFGMYRVTAKILGLEVVEIPLTSDFELDVERIEQEVAEVPSAVFICWPNNPTGNYFADYNVEQVLETDARLVVIDEAYYEFGGRTKTHLTNSDSRVVVLRTLSKALGVAALRIGYLIAHSAKVDEMKKARQPYNLSLPSQKMAEVFVRHADEQLETVSDLLRGRKLMRRDISSIEGLTALPSEASFFLVKVNPDEFGLDAAGIYRQLHKRDIWVRYFDSLPDYLRISVGLPQDSSQLIEQLKKIRKEVLKG